MEPLEMNHSAASFVRLKDSTNILFSRINGKLKVIKRYQNQLLMQLLNLFQCERFKQVGHHANE
jgi:hypothetical protein